jgi:uncharacterized repeat protein (TIGR03803 family)
MVVAGAGSEQWKDAYGNLYGTTTAGGTGIQCNGLACGTVFKLSPSKDGWKEEVLFSFSKVENGLIPKAGLIFDKSGNLYGTTTTGGGELYAGTVFRLSPGAHGGWTESVLYNFDGESNGYPEADLVFDADGNLYGTAALEGNSGCGNQDGCGGAFELTPQLDGTWTGTTLHLFTDSPDAAYPVSGVTVDAQGNVYGVTFYGGTGRCLYNTGGGSIGYSGCGAAYELSPSANGWTEQILFNFKRGGGYAVFPTGGPFFGKDGNLYAASDVGGLGFGTVFALHNAGAGWRQDVVYSFYGSPDGRFPVGNLATDKDGNIFGVTFGGGANNDGTVFDLHRGPSGWIERVLYSFPQNGDVGFEPSAGVVVAPNGHLYGTTRYGGDGTGCNAENLGCGTVYEVIP